MAVIPDQIWHPEKNRPALRAKTSFKIVFIPGNPGLIAFYAEFLQHLSLLLQNSNSFRAANIQFEIIGRSLRGFEAVEPLVFGRASLDSIRHSASAFPEPPVSLDRQIDFVESFIYSLSASNHIEEENFIFIGHSVGAFILLEIIRRFYRSPREKTPKIHVAGGICLFPTVIDIVKSQSGQRIGWLLKLPFLALFLSVLVKVLVILLPGSFLGVSTRFFTRLPEEAVSIIIAFLRSPRGVRQALHMAKDEMNEIRADRWGEEIWGSPEYYPPPLYFYFGRSDHWVADRTRNDLIIRRAYKEAEDNQWKPKMELDTTGIPHGFCIDTKHSLAVAKKCLEYIENIALANH